MKKKKIATLASAVAACAVCGSMIAGVTYAMFTAEDSVDITISTGKVEVITTVADAKIIRPVELGAEETTDIALNVTDGKLELGNILSGDTVKFTVKLTNSGTVDAKYRYSLETLSGRRLMGAFDVTIDGWEESKTGVLGYKSAVDILKAGEDVSYDVTLALDSEKGNEYEGLEAKLTLSSYAVQYNAKFAGEEEVEQIPAGLSVYEVATEEELKAALPQKNAYIMLIDDIDAAGTHFTAKNDSEAVLDLNGHTIVAASVRPAAYGIKNGAGMDLTVKDGTLRLGYYFYGMGDTSLIKFENVHIYTDGTQAIYVYGGDDVEIYSGTYEGRLVYGGTVNFYVDIDNKTLTDGAANVYTFDEMEYVYEASLGGVVLKVGSLIDGVEDKFIYGCTLEDITTHTDNGPVYVDKETGYLIGTTKYGLQYGLANRMLLNINDNWNDTKDIPNRSTITVKGGTFKNFNPANNVAEPDQKILKYNSAGKPVYSWECHTGTNFVADGYKAVYIQDEHGDFWFTVVSEDEVESYIAKGYELAETAENVPLYAETNFAKITVA